MDEIILDEKNYISSKQAAKVTGYAKDYIGQLCREGRVPARLVGRSWYVLESALKDHRFGIVGSTEKVAQKETEEVLPSLPPTWESPRYEASSEELLPKITRPEHAWEAWFDLVSKENDIQEIPSSLQPEEIPDEAPQETTEELREPVITSDLPVRVAINRKIEEEEEFEERLEARPIPKRKKSTGSLVIAIRLIGALVVLLALGVVALGSGYLDQYLPSDTHVELISGVVLYSAE